MASTLEQSAAAEIRYAIDQATAESCKVPGCVFCVVNKDGKILFEHASGKKGADTQAPMTLDSIFWIASCTKMICGIAAMQLCEQGKISLDDVDRLEEVCPELRKTRILKSVDEYGNTEMLDKANRITLRMLLTHTGKIVVILPRLGLIDHHASRLWVCWSYKNFGILLTDSTACLVAILSLMMT